MKAAIQQRYYKSCCPSSTANTEVEKSQSNNVQVGACSCNDLQSDEEIKSLNEVVQLLAEDVLCISTVVSQLQKLVKVERQVKMKAVL